MNSSIIKFSSGLISLTAFSILLLLSGRTYGQDEAIYINNDTIYDEYIGQVELRTSIEWFDMPMLFLGDEESKLVLRFDDFIEDPNDYYVEIRHCDRDWNLSGLNHFDYNDGFDTDLIENVDYSSTLYKVYNHYSYVFPNFNMKPRISGNYLLHVYRFDEIRIPVLTKRFMVVERKIPILVDSDASMIRDPGAAKQQLKLELITENTDLVFPRDNIRVDVYQNGRQDNAEKDLRATFMSKNGLRFNMLNQLTFEAGRQLRNLNLSYTQLLNRNTERISQGEDDIEILLEKDFSRRKRPHFIEPIIFRIPNFGGDNTDIPILNSGIQLSGNGENASPDLEKFKNDFIILREYSSFVNSNIEAEYLRVKFQYDSNYENYGKELHVLGRFLGNRITEKTKMKYEEVCSCYTKELWMKQGIYQYAYVYYDPKTKEVSLAETEGNIFRTQNNYSIFVYYRSPVDRYDQIIGYKNYSSPLYE